MLFLPLIHLLLILGLVDSTYLTYEHFLGTNSGFCPWNNPWLACGRVLDSPYSILGSVPLVVLGVIHYAGMFVWLLLWHKTSRRVFEYLLKIQSTVGLLFSAYLVYIQAVVIEAYCVYCLVSALVSLGVFVLGWLLVRPPKLSETEILEKVS